MKIEGFDPNNRIKELGLEDVAGQLSMEQNTLVLDDIGKKILLLREEQDEIKAIPEMAEYLDKCRERMDTRGKTSELQSVVENKWEKNSDNLNQAIENLRESEKREVEILRELEEIESRMTPQMISNLRRMDDIEEEIIDLESQIENVDLQQTSGGLDEVDGFSLN